MKVLRTVSMPLLAAFLALAALLAPAGGASAQVALTGAGATFPAPLYTRWFNDYAGRTGVQVNYQAVGSGAGIRAITDRTADFGATDGIMTAEQEAAAPGVMHIPTVAGAVVMAFNLPGIEPGSMGLTPEVIAGIFLGEITKWNDSAITSINPQLNLPDRDIVVVRRSDSSGTTFIFTNYLSKVSPAWQRVGFGTSVNWPTGIGAQGNQGVTGEIRANEGAIGYIELTYALQNQIAYASVWNAAGGQYVLPTIESTSAAAEGIALPDDMKVLLTNSPNPNAYPISGFTWLLVRQQQDDPAKGRALVDFLNWALTTGQSTAPELGYSPLSPAARDKALAQVATIAY